jgi:hypothetical protein
MLCAGVMRINMGRQVVELAVPVALSLIKLRTLPVNMCSKFAFAIVVVALVLGGHPAAAVQPSGRPDLPTINLPERARGPAILNALGKDFDAVAAAHGKTPAELRAIIANDNDLWVEKNGKLAYFCTRGRQSNSNSGNSTSNRSLLEDHDHHHGNSHGSHHHDSLEAKLGGRRLQQISTSQAFLLHSLPGASKVGYFVGGLLPGVQHLLTGQLL